MINIFSGEYIEAMTIKNLIENEGIQVFVINQYMSGVEPWVLSPGGFNPITLQVNNDDFEQAQNVIEDYRNGRLDIESGK